ncbi:MAG: CopG family transcriptional regulator [Gammaproteobacteria bacterium]
MRTTLNLDDDVLQAARALSRRRGKPIGVVISELIRRGLGSSHPAEVRSGVRLFPVREGAGTVTPEVVRALLDETD